jgi:hypothetical protein
MAEKESKDAKVYTPESKEEYANAVKVLDHYIEEYHKLSLVNEK